MISDGRIADGCEEVDGTCERKKGMLFLDSESALLLSFPATWAA